MSDGGDTTFADEFDVLGAPETAMTETEVADFRDHLAVVMTLQACANRGTIPSHALDAEATAGAAWARTKAYLDAYNPDPALEANPVPRAVEAMQAMADYGECVVLLSQDEWTQEARLLELAYDGGPYELMLETAAEGES